MRPSPHGPHLRARCTPARHDIFKPQHGVDPRAAEAVINSVNHWKPALLQAAPGSTVIAAVKLNSQHKQNHVASAVKASWPGNGLKVPPGVLKVAPSWSRARVHAQTAHTQANDLKFRLTSRQHCFASAVKPGWRLTSSIASWSATAHRGCDRRSRLEKVCFDG